MDWGLIYFLKAIESALPNEYRLCEYQKAIQQIYSTDEIGDVVVESDGEGKLIIEQ
jgi:hypothetical protein